MLLCAVFFCTPCITTVAQPLPDSLRQPVRVTVTGDANLIPVVRQHLELNLIAAEAALAPDKAIWFFEVKVTRAADETSMVALSMITSQPLHRPQPPPQIENVDSGAWVAEYLQYEHEKDFVRINQHDLVLVHGSDLPETIRFLVEQFRERVLDSIKRRWLKNPGQE